jgi:drug/metabolite transporter (DMT)-like permease
VRNAAQRRLTQELGTLGATLVRFLFGLPYAILFLLVVITTTGSSLPAVNLKFLFWVTVGAISQAAATALLLRTMQERNFALGVAYSKTEILQVAIFALIFLGDALSLPAVLAVISGTLGVMLFSPFEWKSFSSKTLLLGILSGTAFAMSAVGYRGAALALGAPFLVAAATTLVAAQAISTLTLGSWMLIKDSRSIISVFKAWKVSQLPGFMGAAASAGWFTAFAIEPVAHVRTLGLVELVFSYAVSLKLFRERLTARELAGMGLLALGVALVTLRP